jgi:hypothetical protein
VTYNDGVSTFTFFNIQTTARHSYVVQFIMRLDEEEEEGGPRRQPLYAKRSALE